MSPVVNTIVSILFDGLAWAMFLFIISVGLSVTMGLMGVVNLAQLEEAAQLEEDMEEGANRTLGDLVGTPDFPHVHADQGLDLALERMGANQFEILPVVSRADVHELLGVVTLPDVLAAYGVSRPDDA